MEKRLQQLATELGHALLSRGWQVSCGESCTGGGVAAAITSVAGSSDWFGAGFVTYSNAIKHQLLGVPLELLDTCGAVSEPVVLAMARGARQVAAADIAVAVSGIAGPGGGSADKPVGTVWIAWSTATTEAAQCFHFSGDRTSVREQSVTAALEGLLQQIKNTV